MYKRGEIEYTFYTDFRKKMFFFIYESEEANFFTPSPFFAVTL